MIHTLLTIPFLPWILWILYVAMMNIERAIGNGKLPWQARLLVGPTYAVFQLVELLTNVLICTIVFLDLPKEIAVSNRLRRYKNNPNEKRWRLALVMFLKPMLDPFDHKGPHI